MPSVRRATCVEKLSMECTSWRACGNVLQRTLQEKFRDMCDMCDMSVPRPPILSVLLDAVVASDSSNKPATSATSQVRQMKRVEPCFMFLRLFHLFCGYMLHVYACHCMSQAHSIWPIVYLLLLIHTTPRHGSKSLKVCIAALQSILSLDFLTLSRH